MVQEELRVLHLHLKAASRILASRQLVRMRVLKPIPTVTHLFPQGHTFQKCHYIYRNVMCVCVAYMICPPHTHIIFLPLCFFLLHKPIFTCKHMQYIGRPGAGGAETSTSWSEGSSTQSPWLEQGTQKGHTFLIVSLPMVKHSNSGVCGGHAYLTRHRWNVEHKPS